MQNSKVTFKNNEGQVLSGRLELPVDQNPHNFVLFAHCFTCTKNIGAARDISRALTLSGFGVLRFDFTGLGESEGDFADSNFSGNVEDLIAASNFLAENYKAPSILIGHSLGGSAAIFASSEINNIRAVATIGAPSIPNHVQHLFKSSISEIEAKGLATVNIGGRDFTIKKQFLDDLNTKSLPEVVKSLRKPLLIMHSPQDTIVGIENAQEIYLAAHHPKSFISLDGAHHLLLNKKNSQYVGQVIAAWASRYVTMPENQTIKTNHHVAAILAQESGYTTQMKVGNHYMISDEPKTYGGNDLGPSPYQLMSAGLASCTAMTIQMYVRRKGWDLKNVEVHTSHSKQHALDCEDCENSNTKIDTFNRAIKLEGNLDEKQINRILQIADKCPVHKTLHNKVQIDTKLIQNQ